MKKNIPIIVLLLVVIALAIFLPGRKREGDIGNNATSTATSTKEQNTVVLTPGTQATTTPAYKIEIVPSAPSVKAPALYVPTSFPADIPAEAQASIKADIVKENGILAKNPASVEDWMYLAVYRNMMRDWKGAETIWLYLNKVVPHYYLPYMNLSSLYTNNLHDEAKAKIYADLASTTLAKYGLGQ